MDVFVTVTVLIVVIGLFVAVTRRRFAREGNKAEQIRAMLQEVDRYHNKRRRAESRNAGLDVAAESE
jgi:hypothetical protein